MLNEQMRKLVDTLNKTNSEYVQEIHNHGGVSLKASKLGRTYKDIQREIIKVDIVKEKNKY
jgi:predicted transcriptional regulator